MRAYRMGACICICESACLLIGPARCRAKKRKGCVRTSDAGRRRLSHHVPQCVFLLWPKVLYKICVSSPANVVMYRCERKVSLRRLDLPSVAGGID